MTKQREWQTWPKRLREEINSTSGLFALGGGGISGLGLLTTSTVVVGGGLALTAGTVLYSIIKSVPPAKVSAKSLLGTRVDDLRQLEGVHPPLSRIGFIGNSQSGKTTLLSQLGAIAFPTSERTERPYADVTCLPGAPDHLIAFVDAAGQQFAQQFKVLNESHHAVILLDHNASHTARELDPERIKKHEDFLVQVAAHISENDIRIKNVCILVNKSDLWLDGPDARSMRDWGDACSQSWSMVPGIKLSVMFHSNFKAQDITSLVKLMRNWK